MKGGQGHEGRALLPDFLHVWPGIFCQMDGQTLHEPCWKRGPSTLGRFMNEHMDELMTDDATEQGKILERTLRGEVNRA